MKWKVHIPAGRWMAGVETFSTKRRAMNFIEDWNKIAIKVGETPVEFVQSKNKFCELFQLLK